MPDEIITEVYTTDGDCIEIDPTPRSKVDLGEIARNNFSPFRHLTEEDYHID
jgi:hypothetical protein